MNEEHQKDDKIASTSGKKQGCSSAVEISKLVFENDVEPENRLEWLLDQGKSLGLSDSQLLALQIEFEPSQLLTAEKADK